MLDWGIDGDYYTDAAKVVRHMRVATAMDKGYPQMEVRKHTRVISWSRASERRASSVFVSSEGRNKDMWPPDAPLWNVMRLVPETSHQPERPVPPLCD
jgi:hypothetical protein